MVEVLFLGSGFFDRCFTRSEEEEDAIDEEDKKPLNISQISTLLFEKLDELGIKTAEDKVHAHDRRQLELDGMNHDGDTIPDPFASMGPGVMMFFHQLRKLLWMSVFAFIFYFAYYAVIVYTVSYDTNGKFNTKQLFTVDLGLLLRAQATCTINFLKTSDSIFAECP